MPTISIMKQKMANMDKDQEFHVLVVDDEFLIRHITAKVLKNQGICVDIAEDGKQAQAKILDGQYDLVITDINMPEMNGVELLYWLKKHRPFIDGIVMTGYDVSDIQSNEKLEWVREFLIKPFPMEKLQEAVMRCMKRKQSMKGCPKKESEIY